MITDDGPFHRLAANCKFCHKPITIEIADSYTNDQYKLLPLACCNACADNRTERRRLERKVQFVVTCLQLAGANKTEALVQTTRGQLTKLTKAYAALISRCYGQEGGLWDQAIVEQIIEHPGHWGDSLGHMWRSFRQWQREQQAQPQLGV